MPEYNGFCGFPIKNSAQQGLMQNTNWDENEYLIVSIYPVSSHLPSRIEVDQSEISVGGSLFTKSLAMLNFP